MEESFALKCRHLGIKMFGGWACRNFLSRYFPICSHTAEFLGNLCLISKFMENCHLSKKVAMFCIFSKASVLG